MSRRLFASAAIAGTLPRPNGTVPLRDIAARRGILFGSEITAEEVVTDPDYAALVRRECAVVTPGIEGKWGIVEPGEGEFRLEPLDTVLAFARVGGLHVHMHTMVWAVGMPRWLVQALAEGRGAAVLHRHAKVLATHTKGIATSWDVVNEPIDPRWPSAPEGLCNTPWRTGLGPDYVADAFAAVGQADPTACLMINDDDLEYDSPDREAKRTLYLRRIEQWKRAGVKIGGFGLEAHLKPWLPIAETSYRRFLAELAGLDLRLAVTELDVCDRSLPADIAKRDRAAADLCRRYLDLVLDEPALRTVICWGLSDRTTWMRRDRTSQRLDGLAPRPCPYDAELQPKPMRAALVRAFTAAPTRG